MAKAYRTKSSKGPGGTRKYTTQSQSGKVKTTMSYSGGTSTRTAYTRNGDGSVVKRTTQKRPDGYVTRTTKTIISKYKPTKFPKPPKPPKLKPSVVKEAAPYKPPKAPKAKPPKAAKPFKFTWPASKPRKTSSSRQKTPMWTWVFWTVVLISLLSMCSG